MYPFLSHHSKTVSLSLSDISLLNDFKLFYFLSVQNIKKIVQLFKKILKY